MITVRRATLADKESVFKFIRLAYEGRWQYKAPERWQWEFVDNPFLESWELPVFIAVDEQGAVVGQSCTLVEPLQVGKKTVKVGWSVDTYLLPEYRGQGIGFQLQRANDEGNPIFMSLSMSEANRRIKSGLGSTPLDPVPSYTRLVRYTPESVLQAALSRAGSRAGRFLPLVRACLHWTLADRAAAGLLNLGRDLADRSLLAGAAQDIHISPVDRFGAEIDALWEKVSPCFHAAVVRNAAYLNWKYVRQPHVGYQRFIAWRGDEACGYVILRVGKPPERRLGILADLLADPQDTSAIRTLLVYAVRYFKDARVKDISAASTVREFQSGYLALGFRKDKELYPMMHCKYEGAEFEKAKEPGAWCLGRGDHDWDQYPLGR